jgi:uncharacterized Ntn-hydrolase superfamily protein
MWSPFAHTYSIVARDADSERLGAAIQSHYFCVGVGVIWVESGAGAIATQAMSEPAHGYRGLDLLRTGLDAASALSALISVDPGARTRQVAVLDRQGSAACHTGDRCIRYAAHHVGDGYSVQANMMLTDRVVPAMAEAFEATRGPLEERLMATLEAAEAAGGDIRGRQSAALRIVEGAASGRPWEDVRVDLRVDDHAEPLEELRRLVAVHRAYARSRAAGRSWLAGDAEEFDALYAEAIELVPGNLELRFWRAFSLMLARRSEEAIEELARVFEADPGWAELLRRTSEAGVAPGELVASVLRATDRS